MSFLRLHATHGFLPIDKYQPLTSPKTQNTVHSAREPFDAGDLPPSFKLVTNELSEFQRLHIPNSYNLVIS